MQTITISAEASRLIDAIVMVDKADASLGSLGPLGRAVDDLREKVYEALGNEAPALSDYAIISRDGDALTVQNCDGDSEVVVLVVLG